MREKTQGKDKAIEAATKEASAIQGMARENADCSGTNARDCNGVKR